MAFRLLDRAKESVSGTPGTGSFTLGGASPGWLSFSGAGMTNGDTTPYLATEGNNWEIGLGTWSTGGTLARTSINKSSNSNAAVSFTSAVIVQSTLRAEDIGTAAGNLVQLDSSAKLPPVDGSQLTAVPAASSTDVWTGTNNAKAVTALARASALGWVTLTDATTISVASTSGRNFKVQIAGSRTMGFPSGTLVTGDEFNFLVQQDSTGNRTLAWAAGYEWDGDTSFATGTTASKYSLFNGIVIDATHILLTLVAVNFSLH